MQLGQAPKFGWFYNCPRNEFTYSFIKSGTLRICYHCKALLLAKLLKMTSSGLANSANQNNAFETPPSALPTACQQQDGGHSPRRNAHFESSIWIISSFCINIYTKCITTFVNNVITPVQTGRTTLECFSMLQFNKLVARVPPGGHLGLQR